SERTGPSRTPCTGSWTWSFATTNAASEPTTPRPISPPAGTSPTISPERPRARIPSASGAKPQVGTTSISPASSPRDGLHPIPLGLDLISVNKVKIVTLADKQKQSVNPNAAIARTTSEYRQE